MSSSPMRRALLVNLAVFMMATVVALVGVELTVRALGMDWQTIPRVLYYQGVLTQVNQVSQDPVLHYELKPGATFLNVNPQTQAVEEVSINAHGSRGPDFLPQKPAGTFRILMFDGSSLFGAGVRDRETTAAMLEQNLNEARGPSDPHFEVLNFGTNAYNLAQAAHLARAKLTSLSPDLIVVMAGNRGRRAFLGPAENPPGNLRAIFEADPEHYLENFPAPGWLSEEVHLLALQHLATWRYIMAWMRKDVEIRQSPRGEAISRREARALYEEAGARNVPVLFVPIPGAIFDSPAGIFPGLPPQAYYDLNVPGKDKDFYQAHPPAKYLAEWATELGVALVERQLVPLTLPKR